MRKQKKFITAIVAITLIASTPISAFADSAFRQSASESYEVNFNSEIIAVSPGQVADEAILTEIEDEIKDTETGTDDTESHISEQSPTEDNDDNSLLVKTEETELLALDLARTRLAPFDLTDITTSGELQLAIDNANDGDEIEITSDIIFTETVLIPADLSLDFVTIGGPYIFDYQGNALERHFVLENNAYIHFGDSFSNKPSNIIFEGNNLGGGILVKDNAYLELSKNAVFQNCTAENGGAIYKENSGRLYLYTISFIGCNAEKNGGAIYAEGDDSGSSEINIEVVSIDSCSAGLNGGGIYSLDEFTIYESGVFSNNKALGDGGAIFLSADEYGSPARIYKSIFFGNEAINGGALKIESGLHMEECEIYENTANESGGGIYTESVTGNEIHNIRIHYSNIDSNTAVNGSGGGIFIGDNAQLSLLSCTVNNNTAYLNGGGAAIFGDYAKLTTDSSGTYNEISYNKVISSNGNGGGVWVYQGMFLGFTCLISNNSAVNGGGIYYEYDSIINDSTYLLIDGIVCDNTAEINGGGIAIYTQSADPDMLFDIPEVHSNKAGQNGGGIYVQNTSDTVENTPLIIELYYDIYNNEAGQNGGGIYSYSKNQGTDFIMETSEIRENTAGKDGGGIYLGSSLDRFEIPDFNYCSIINNQAKGNGGGIYTADFDYALNGGGYTNIITNNNTVFAGNTAKAAYPLPASAAVDYPAIEYESTSLGDDYHPINNYDINHALEFNITYLPNGAQGGSYTETAPAFSSYTVLAPTNGNLNYTYQDHTFKEWNTKTDGSGISYASSSQITLEDDMTLYAVWTENEKPVTPPDGNGGGGTGSLKQYKVTFYWNNGTNNVYATKEVSNGGRVSPPADPQRIDYKFTGWYTSEECITIYDFSAPVRGNLSLYAGWEPLVLPQFTTDHYAYIVGYDNGTVRPEGQITRAEVATIFFRMLDDEYRDTVYSKTNEYSDVNADHWFNIAVSTMTQSGTLHGYPDGTFNPNGYITRGEFATVIAQFTGGQYNGDDLFSDISGHWAQKYINHASNIGWIEGYPDGSYKPNSFITRAETVSLVNRILERNPESTEDLHEDMIEWPDNMDTTKWYYLDIQEATNSHDYDIKDNGHEEWTALRSNRDWRLLER